jgi:hypothetical protein
MSAPFNPRPKLYQEDIEQINKCIDYLDKSLYDINKNVENMSPYIPMLSTQKNGDALRDDIERMHPTVARLVSDISRLTSEYRAILENGHMDSTLEEKITTLYDRLMDINSRKRTLFDNIVKTMAKYHIQFVYAPPKKLNQSKQPNQPRQINNSSEHRPIPGALMSIKEENNAESSGGRRRYKKRTLRKRTHHKRTKRARRNRA